MRSINTTMENEQDGKQVNKQEDDQTEQEYDHIEGLEQERVQEQDRDRSESHPQSSECIDELTAFMRAHMDILPFLIKTEYGLLDVLVSNNVLSSKQISVIKEEGPGYYEGMRLFEEITK